MYDNLTIYFVISFISFTVYRSNLIKFGAENHSIFIQIKNI